MEGFIFIKEKVELDTGIYLKAFCPEEFYAYYKRYIIDKKSI